MGQVSFAQTIHAEQMGDFSPAGSGKNQGTFKVDGKEYSVFMFADSESVTEAVSQFLQDINQQEPPETLLDFEFVHITEQLMETEQEIAQLLGELFSPEEAQEPSEQVPHAAQREGQLQGKIRYQKKNS